MRINMCVQAMVYTASCFLIRYKIASGWLWNSFYGGCPQGWTGLKIPGGGENIRGGLA